eukprot:TRINITY_DN11201_c0_g1_i1.p1 TRINITY_DN11201_c0_g1~~TRINITY_DN11201_c0_g1_i1.p1  ORF type:complete len:418 (+),score=110.48 TRINITY_DN11201_c0_g1_i1:54-1307(+)
MLSNVVRRSRNVRKCRRGRFYSNAQVNENGAYIVAGKRTPFGKFGGSLKDISLVDLAVTSSKNTLESVNVDPQEIDHVIFGNVIPSTVDATYAARHLGLKVGYKTETGGYSVNRLCGSGIQAIVDAKHMIQRGEAEVVLSAGAENMSITPHLVYGGRFGTRYGALKNVDLLLDSLTDQNCNTPMAITAENLAEKYNISRQECDEYSLESHKKAASAYENNLLQGELAPVALKRGSIEKDEHVRYDCSLEDMTKLRSSFKKDGTVTPATASGVVDGAASVLVCSGRYIKEKGLKPIAEILDYSAVGVEPTEMGIGPVPAIQNVLASSGLTSSDIDLFEINEAFASQVLSCIKVLDLDQNKVNIWGGSVAIGHPLGGTGVRITNTLSRQLQHTSGKYGIASACIGGGQGIAVLLKNVSN